VHRWVETSWNIVPLKGVRQGREPEVPLGDGLALIRADERLLAARDELFLGKVEFEAIGKSECFLVLRTSEPDGVDVFTAIERLQDALMAFQIVKPIETFGFIFSGTQQSGGNVRWHGTNDRGWPMRAGQWAQMRVFDEPLLIRAKALLTQVRETMKGPHIAKRNAVHLLQLALEHPHPLIACMLAVTGIEAILDSADRWDFESKICTLLGDSTLAFPDWNSPEWMPPKYTVKDLAVHLYTLRSKIAHGANLLSAIQDKKSPVNFSEMKEYIPGVESVQYATLLGESAIYLLCQVLQRVIAAP
jgi:hypothetical protein